MIGSCHGNGPSETGYHYVDWSAPVYSLENIIKIAKKWADCDYEKRGGVTIKNWMKRLQQDIRI